MNSDRWETQVSVQALSLLRGGNEMRPAVGGCQKHQVAWTCTLYSRTQKSLQPFQVAANDSTPKFLHSECLVAIRALHSM